MSNQKFVELRRIFVKLCGPRFHTISQNVMEMKSLQPLHSKAVGGVLSVDFRIGIINSPRSICLQKCQCPMVDKTWTVTDVVD